MMRAHIDYAYFVIVSVWDPTTCFSMYVRSFLLRPATASFIIITTIILAVQARDESLHHLAYCICMHLR